MSFLMKARFSGGMAETHQLPAYEGAQSLYGISRSALITLNYLAEGRVRRREFAPRAFQINLIESRRGSFEAIFEILVNPGMMTIVSTLGAYRTIKALIYSPRVTAMSRMLLTVKQTGSPIRCHQRAKVTKILRGLGLHRVGQTADVPDTPQARGMLSRVRHLVEVIFVQIDIAWLADQVRELYREMIVGSESRVTRGQVLWDQFEAAVVRCLADPRRDDRELTEKINEIAVAAVLLDDNALEGKQIQYEPQLLPDDRKIDFVVDRGADNLYVEVKTVRPRSDYSDKAWDDFVHRKQFHPKNVEYLVTKEGSVIRRSQRSSRRGTRSLSSLRERIALVVGRAFARPVG